MAQIPDHVVLTLCRPAAERDAATDYVRSVEYTADEWDEEYGPLWLGHALHRAFLDGIDWERQRRSGKSELKTPLNRCAECAAEYAPRRVSQRFCGRRCAQRSACRRWRAKKKQALPERRPREGERK